MGALRTDLVHSFRSLLRAPGFSLLVICTLGVAMAGNLSVFALLDALVLRPLPVEKPGELVLVSIPPLRGTGPGIAFGERVQGGRMLRRASYAQYLAFRDLNVFQGMALHFLRPAALSAGSDAVPVKVLLTTGSYFGMLGVKASLGRPLTPDDDLANRPPIVVLSHGFWQRQFGDESSVINRTIRLNQVPMTIVGVASSGFTGTVSGEAPDVFVPLKTAGAFVPYPGFTYDAPGYYLYTLIARLAPGIDIREAERVAERLYQQLLAEGLRNSPPRTDVDRRRIASFHVTLLPGGYAFSQQSTFSRDLQTPLTLLMAMVGLILVVAAGNVANLMLAREEARSREVAIRYALGASRSRILRERLISSLYLASAAAVLGLLLASWWSGLAPVVLNVERLPSGITPAPDHRAGTLAVGLALATALGIWAASALRATRRSSLPSLIEQAGVGGGPRALQWRRGMVVVQVALSLVLLCGSLVLSHSLVRLMSVDPGFEADHLYSFSVDPSQARYEPARAMADLEQILEQLRGLQGVRSASLTARLPLSDSSASYLIGDRNQNDTEGLLTETTSVGPDYFRTLGISVIAGREFTREDSSSSTHVAVLNEPLAHVLFGDENPLGRRIGFAGQPADIQVVGIVKGTKTGSLRAPVSPGVFLQQRGTSPIPIVFVIRTTGQPVSLDTVRAIVKRIMPSVPVLDFGSVAYQVTQSLYRDRTMASLSIVFAGLSSMLCAVGVFGLTRFSVSRRTSEIAVRLALGARRTSIHWLVLREVLWLAGAGCAVGVIAFVASSRVLTSLVFEIAPTDPPSVAVAVGVLAVITTAAALVPAYHAARQDPARTLRQE